MDTTLCPDCHRPYADHDDTCYQAKSRIESEALARDIVDKLSRYVNQGRPAKYIVVELAREHRTLQQSMTTVMLQWFVHLASLSENFYDLRNEAAVKTAKVILPVLKTLNVVIQRRDGNDEAYLPLI
jgi:hypothetical protein